MDPELEALVQRMIDAGESEENIRIVIEGWDSEMGAQPEQSALRRFLGGIGSQAVDTVTGTITGLRNLVTDPVGSAKQIYESQLQQFDKAGTAAGEGRTSEAIGYGLAGLIPFLGPAAASIGEKVGTGRAENLGSAVTDLAVLSLPKTGAPILRGADNAVRATGQFLEAHPSVASAAGAAAGYLYGDVPGAVAGASGGGIVGRLGRLLGKETPVPHRPTARGYDRYAPNTSGARRGATTWTAPSQVDDSIRAIIESPVDRYAPNTSGVGGGTATNVVTSEVDDVVRALNAPMFDRYAPNTSSYVPRRQQLIDELNAADDIATQADIEFQAANPAVPRTVAQPTEAALNASGESAASLEALNRMSSMARQGQRFAVRDRSGNIRQLIGPDAVDYRVRPGESYGVLDETGNFRVLDQGPGATHAPVRGSSSSTTVDLDVVPDVYDLSNMGNVDTILESLGVRVAPKASSSLPPHMKPRVRVPTGGVKTDAELGVLLREAESGRGGIGSEALHRDIFGLDQAYRRAIGR